MKLPGDPGLQPERTALAWRRTALAMLVNGALLVRAAVEKHSPLVAAVSATILLCALALFAISAWRGAVLARAQAHSAPPAGLLMFVRAAVWLACGAALVGVL